MQIDAFIFKILLLSVPGFVTYIIYRKVAIYRRSSKSQFGFHDVFIVIIYSLVSCGIYDLLILFINLIFKADYTDTLSKLFNVEIFNIKELSFLIIIAVLLGFLFSLFETKRIINKIAIKLKISQYYGDTDVWTAFNSNKSIEWIYVRDHKLKLVYFGRLAQYSDPGEVRELILSDVQVFTEDGEFCYKSPTMYICRQSDEITLEIPLTEEGEKNEIK